LTSNTTISNNMVSAVADPEKDEGNASPPAHRGSPRMNDEH